MIKAIREILKREENDDQLINDINRGDIKTKSVRVKDLYSSEPFIVIRKSDIMGAIVLFITILLTLMVKYLNGFAEWYASHVYPVFVNTISRVLSIFPFSISEILIIILALWLLYRLALAIYRLIRKQNRLSETLFSAFRWLVLTAVWICFIFTLMAGINYQRNTFSQMAGFSTSQYSQEDLYSLSIWLAKEVNLAAAQVNRDEQGLMVLPDNYQLIASESMGLLGEEYQVLSGYYPRAKGVIFSQAMSYQLIEGIYSPFTIEANYNTDMLSSNIPAAICHELSHLKGFMREDEANFIAYLACRGSESAEFQYSGYMLAFIYSTNALYREAGADVYGEVWNILDDQVKNEIYADHIFWDSYRGPISETASVVNDTYLKVNSQADGVKSYGRMVDLLLAEFLESSDDKILESN